MKIIEYIFFWIIGLVIIIAFYSYKTFMFGIYLIAWFFSKDKPQLYPFKDVIDGKEYSNNKDYWTIPNS